MTRNTRRTAKRTTRKTRNKHSDHVCRFVNDALHIRESEKNLFRRMPVKRSHRKIIVLALANSQLFSKVFKWIELMRSIKFFIIFSVTAFNLTVMTWSKRTNKFMSDLQLLESNFKERRFLWIPVTKSIGKFKSIVGLNAFNGIREFLNHMLDGFGWRNRSEFNIAFWPGESVYISGIYFILSGSWNYSEHESCQLSVW